MNKIYLGDSVYAEATDFGAIKLTTENGLPTDPSNTIVMEPEVLAALDDYREAMRKEHELILEQQLKDPTGEGE